MKPLLYLSMLIFLAACAGESTTSKEVIYNQDPYNDVMTIFYPDKKTVKQTFEMRDSIKQGEAVQFYETGEVNTIIQFDKGLKQDRAIYYRKSGGIYRKTPYVDDQKHGLQVGYYDSGDIMFEMPYRNGDPIPGLQEFSEAGKLVPEPKIVFEKNPKGGYRASIDPKRTKVEYYNVSSYMNGKEKIHTTNSRIESKRGKCEVSTKREIGAKIYTSNRACYLVFGSPK